MIVQQDTKVSETKLTSDSEPINDEINDENKTDDPEIKTIEPSNQIISSVKEDPIKPVTPVTFPESGTESEVSETIHISCTLHNTKTQKHVYFIDKLVHVFVSLGSWLSLLWECFSLKISKYKSK